MGNESVGHAVQPELGDAAVVPLSAARRVGRPRDPEVERRMLVAALDIYETRGWAGFNFDVVAREAGVSKDAIYRRFETRAELLVAALRAQVMPLATTQTDERDLYQALSRLAHSMLTRLTGPHGLVGTRLLIEARSHPDLDRAVQERLIAPEVVAARAMVRRAMDEGALPGVSSPTALIEAVVGAVQLHVLVTGPERRADVMRRADAYVDELVRMVLTGAGYRPETAKRSRRGRKSI